MVGEIKKSYPLAQQYLEKVYVLISISTRGWQMDERKTDKLDEKSL